MVYKLTDVTTPNDVRTDPTLLSYSSAITEQKKWHGTVVGSKVLPLSNFSEKLEHAPTCNKVRKRRQHVAPSIVATYWPIILHGA